MFSLKNDDRTCFILHYSSKNKLLEEFRNIFFSNADYFGMPHQNYTILDPLERPLPGQAIVLFIMFDYVGSCYYISCGNNEYK